MKGNATVIDEWVAHVTGKWERPPGRSRHVFADGGTLYSYGRHYPLAVWHRDARVFLVNSERYSVTTSRHRWLATVAIGDAGFRRFEVPEPTDARAPENAAYLAEVCASAWGRVERARWYAAGHARTAQWAGDTLRAFCAVFNLPLATVPQPSERAQLKLAKLKLLGKL